MKELEFRFWLKEKKVNNKVIKDMVSRVKKIQSILDDMDFEDEYKKDHCKELLTFFDNRGLNDYSKKYIRYNDLPIGKNYIATYKYALKKYIEFLEEYLLK